MELAVLKPSPVPPGPGCLIPVHHQSSSCPDDPDSLGLDDCCWIINLFVSGCLFVAFCG